jgi:hypothetical protein
VFRRVDRRALRLLGLLLVATSLAYAAEPGMGKVALEIAPKEATVGDVIEATLTIEVPKGTAVDREGIGSEIGPFAVLSRTWQGPVAVGDRERWTCNLGIAAYETGKLTLPAITVRIVRGEGQQTLETEPVDVTIRSVLPAAAEGDKAIEVADLKPPVSVAPDFTILRRAIGIVAVLFALAGLAWWLHRRYASKLAAVAAPQDPFHRVAPYVWVYGELQRLLERRLAEEGKIDLFFSELARIMKQYLEGRYRVELMEHTTDEVAPRLQQAGATSDVARSVRALLDRCDLVKFARVLPDAAACRAEVEAAYRIVDATKPMEAVASATSTGGSTGSPRGEAA